MELPLQSDDIIKLLSIYDKKGEGKINYDDFISEQKYIHAVSHSLITASYSTMTLYMYFGHLSCTYMYLPQQYKLGPNDDIKAKKVCTYTVCM